MNALLRYPHSDSDDQFFEANPGRSYRFRPAEPGEVAVYRRKHPDARHDLFVFAAVHQAMPGARDRRLWTVGRPVRSMTARRPRAGSSSDTWPQQEGARHDRARRNCPERLRPPAGLGRLARRAKKWQGNQGALIFSSM
jgi:hypothetical protein